MAAAAVPCEVEGSVSLCSFPRLGVMREEEFSLSSGLVSVPQPTKHIQHIARASTSVNVFFIALFPFCTRYFGRKAPNTIANSSSVARPKPIIPGKKSQPALVQNSSLAYNKKDEKNDCFVRETALRPRVEERRCLPTRCVILMTCSC